MSEDGRGKKPGRPGGPSKGRGGGPRKPGGPRRPGDKGRDKGRGKGGAGKRGPSPHRDRTGRRDPANPGSASPAGNRFSKKPSPPPPGIRLAEVEEVEVKVEKLVAGGDGLGRFEGIPLFIPRSAPGDRLRVRLTDRRPDYGRAEIVEILEPGPGRREAPCPHFERCGGCDLQHLEDDLQTRLKVAAVLETLSRLGGVKLEGPPKVRLEVHTAGHWGYRLRTQFHTRGGGAGLGEAGTGEAGERDEGARGDAESPVRIGYYERGTNDLVPITACPILVPELESLIPVVPAKLAAAGGRIPRRVDLAAGGLSGAIPVRTEGTGAAPGGSAATGPVTSAPKVDGLPHGEIRLTVPLPGGESYDYAYDARCFFQAHRDLVPKLVQLAVGDWRGEQAFDLYAGVGLFALPLAGRYAGVTAVEGDSIAARYARRNARTHDLDSKIEVQHLALESWIGYLPDSPDRVLVDPPRDGLSTTVRRALRDSRPARLTYVSCHPATLARDIRAMADTFRLESLDLLEMFPQTGHMEAVAQLVRLESGQGEGE